MSGQVDILAAVRACLASISQANGHPLTVRQVLRGQRNPRDLRPLPAVGFYRENLQSQPQAGGVCECGLGLGVWGFAACPAEGDCQAVHQLEDAVCRVLQDPTLNPWWASTILGEAGYLELDGLAGFDLAVTINYEAAR